MARSLNSTRRRPYRGFQVTVRRPTLVTWVLGLILPATLTTIAVHALANLPDNEIYQLSPYWSLGKTGDVVVLCYLPPGGMTDQDISSRVGQLTSPRNGIQYELLPWRRPD